MRIAYITSDEVNQAWASELAERDGHALVPSPVGPPHRQVDAVVYDLDYLPVEVREHLLRVLRSQPPLLPVAVHSYNLEADCVKALHRNGVLAYRRLHSKMFRQLSRIVARDRRWYGIGEKAAA